MTALRSLRAVAPVASSLAILDIFCEIFVHNSFEQLLINYTSGGYNRTSICMYSQRGALYQSEGIDMPTVGFLDNTPTSRCSMASQRMAEKHQWASLQPRRAVPPPPVGRLPHSRTL